MKTQSFKSIVQAYTEAAQALNSALEEIGEITASKIKNLLEVQDGEYCNINTPVTLENHELRQVAYVGDRRYVFKIKCCGNIWIPLLIFEGE